MKSRLVCTDFARPNTRSVFPNGAYHAHVQPPQSLAPNGNPNLEAQIYDPGYLVTARTNTRKRRPEQTFMDHNFVQSKHITAGRRGHSVPYETRCLATERRRPVPPSIHLLHHLTLGLGYCLHGRRVSTWRLPSPGTRQRAQTVARHRVTTAASRGKRSHYCNVRDRKSTRLNSSHWE